jgi:hypothetical protein
LKYEELQTNVSLAKDVLGFAKELCGGEEAKCEQKRRFIFLLMNPAVALHKIKFRNDSIYEVIPRT